MRPKYVLKIKAELTTSGRSGVSTDAPAQITVPYDRAFTIGRGPENSLSLPADSQLSTQHFQVQATPHGCRVKDLESTNGLFLNGERVNEATAIEGDTIQAGQTAWVLALQPSVEPAYRPSSDQRPQADDQFSGEADQPATDHPASSAFPGRTPAEFSGLEAKGSATTEPSTSLKLTTSAGDTRIIQQPKTLSIGRTSLAEWIFPTDPEMSSLHLEFFFAAGRWQVRDCQSTNGTFVNEKRIESSTLSPGDTIRAGSTRFTARMTSPRAVRDTLDRTGTSGQNQPGPFEREVPSLPPRETSGFPGQEYQVTDSSQPSHGGPLKPLRQPARLTPAPVTSKTTPPATGAGDRTIQWSARLKCLRTGAEYDLPIGVEQIIGRSPQADISFPDDPQASTEHAGIVFSGQEIRVHDLGSTNGTFVGGKLTKAARLNNGDVLRVGQTELRAVIDTTQPTDFQADHAHEPPFVSPKSTPASATSAETSLPPKRTSMPAATAGPAAPKELEQPPSYDSDDRSPALTEPGQEQPASTNPDELPYFDFNDFDSEAESGTDLKSGAESDDNASYTGQAESSGDATSTDPPAYAAEASGGQALTNPKDEEPPAELASKTDRLDQIEDWSLEDFEEGLPDSPTNFEACPSESVPVEIDQVPEPEVPKRPENSAIDSSDVSEPAHITDTAPREFTAIPERSFASGESISFQAYPCGSGLVLYRGASPGFDPLKIALRLAQATRGWVFNGQEVDRWLAEHEKAQPDTLPLLPARADDASWMVPFTESWGSDQTWLVYARADVDDVLRSFVDLGSGAGQEGSFPVQPITPASLADFLANHATTTVHRFFNPLDAVLMEVHGGERWAIFGRSDLEVSLRELRFVHRQQW